MTEHYSHACPICTSSIKTTCFRSRAFATKTTISRLALYIRSKQKSNPSSKLSSSGLNTVLGEPTVGCKRWDLNSHPFSHEHRSLTAELQLVRIFTPGHIVNSHSAAVNHLCASHAQSFDTYSDQFWELTPYCTIYFF